MAGPEDSDPIVETRFPDHTVIVPPHPLENAVSRTGESAEIAMDAVERANDALAEISEEFRGWMNDECEALEAARAAIRRHGPAPEAVETIFAAAHDIRGHAAVYGYPLAGMIAATLCRLVEECPAAAIPLALVDRHVGAVRAVVSEDVRRADDPTGAEIHRRLAALTETHLAQFKNRDAGADGSASLPSVVAPPL